MAWWKIAVYPLLTHCRYCSLELSHRCVRIIFIIGYLLWKCTYTPWETRVLLIRISLEKSSCNGECNIHSSFIIHKFLKLDAPGYQQIIYVSEISLAVWRHQMATFSVLLALCTGSHKGQWRRSLVFSLICAWINGSVNDREAGDLRRHSAHYDVIVMDDNVW